MKKNFIVENIEKYFLGGLVGGVVWNLDGSKVNKNRKFLFKMKNYVKHHNIIFFYLNIFYTKTHYVKKVQMSFFAFRA